MPTSLDGGGIPGDMSKPYVDSDERRSCGGRTSQSGGAPATSMLGATQLTNGDHLVNFHVCRGLIDPSRLVACRPLVSGGDRIPRPGLTSLVLASLLTLAVACGTGGREYWLYPGPRLEGPEDAVFVAREDDQILAIDDEETAIRCWGELRGPRPYGQRDSSCRLHIRPGEHIVVFSPGPNSRDRVRLEFTALPGKSYGLDWSACRGSVNQTYQRTCLVNVVELAVSPSS